MPAPTPGPWGVTKSFQRFNVETGFDARGHYVAGRHQLVAECFFEADAQLIAVVPKMVAALIDLIGLIARVAPEYAESMMVSNAKLLITENDMPVVATNENPRTRHIDIVFDGPPSPEGAGFVEIEIDSGRSVMLGRWIKRPDGYHVIRITREDAAHWLLADSEAVRLGIIP